MSSSKDDCLISKGMLTDGMEAIEQGITTPKGNPKCTEVILLQEATGSAVADLPAVFQTCGFAHLADTTERFQQCLPEERKNLEPAEMPIPAMAPSTEERGGESVTGMQRSSSCDNCWC